MTLYADDPDVHVTFEVTDATGNNDISPAVVKVAGYSDITAAWIGAPAPVRKLKVPLYGLPAYKRIRLSLAIPGDNDVEFEPVVLRERVTGASPVPPSTAELLAARITALEAGGGTGSGVLTVVNGGTVDLDNTKADGYLIGYRVTATTTFEGVDIAPGSYVFERDSTVTSGWTYRTLATATEVGEEPEPTVTYDTEVLADTPSTFLRFESNTTNSGSSSEVYTPTDITYVTGLGDGTQAADFNGATSTLICADGGNQGVGGCTALTVEALVSVDGPGDIFFQFGCFKLDVAQSASDYVPRTVVTTSGDATVVGSNPLVPGTTYHLAATWDGTTVTLYVNGVSVGTPAACTGTTPNYASFPPSSGGPNSTKFNGRVDGLAVYRNAALSGARILAHAQAAGLA